MVRSATFRSHTRPDPIRIVAISASIALNAAMLALLVRPPEFVPVPQTEIATAPQWITPTPIPVTPPLPIVKPHPQPPQPSLSQRVEPTHLPIAPPVISDDPSVIGITVDPNAIHDTGGGTITQDVAPPVVTSLTSIASPAPTYPRDALRNGITGTVELLLLVDVDGHVLQVQIARSSGDRSLDNAARDQVLRNWRFQPAMRDGVAVQSLGKVPIVFTLDGR